MSYLAFLPVQVLSSLGYENYANGTVNYASYVSYPYNYELNPAIQGISGPRANYSTKGDVVVNYGLYTNYGYIDKLFVKQGPVDNYGVINCIYLEQGSLANYGTVNHIHIRDGHLDNFGVVHDLYKVQLSTIVANYGQTSYVNQYSGNLWNQHDDLWNRHDEASYSSPYEDEASYSSPYEDEASYSSPYEDEASYSFPYDYEYEPVDSDDTIEGSVLEDSSDVDPELSSPELDAEYESNLQAISSGESKGICCRICFEPVLKREPVSTHCGHIYCKWCLVKSLKRRRERKCPTCNMELPRDNLYHRIFI
jgi:hypothetical protein